MKTFIRIAAVFLSISLGGCAVSTSKQERVTLTWEWPGDRIPAVRMIVHVGSVESKGRGMFGIGRSPSIAANLPDPINLEGTVTVGDQGWATKSIRIVLPRAEVPDLKAGEYVALAITDGSTAICASQLPNGLGVSEQSTWLAGWKCGALR